MYRGSFNIFGEESLTDYFEDIDAGIRQEIESESEDYILSVNEEDYITHLTEVYTIDNLDIDFEGVFISSSRRAIRGDYHPSGFNVRSGKDYDRQVIKYHIPFNGNTKLLECLPSSYVSRTEKVTIEEGCICFEIIQFRDDPEVIKRDADSILSFIRLNTEGVIRDVNTYNQQLQAKVASIFQTRKQRILKEKGVLAALGVPIKKRADLPETFAVPSPKIPRKIIPRPQVKEKGYKPEPTLDLETYRDILNIINDLGKEFERYPSLYEGKDEEALRDQILLFLQPRYEGSATGETFNKQGKTDILMRHENSNVFVAECKFWNGSKKYLEAFDQLLSYLTWRDSKAALILFVKRKDFSAVLTAIEEKAPEHSNYLGFVDQSDESWFNYRFHIPGDRNREVKLAVLAFHIPTA